LGKRLSKNRLGGDGLGWSWKPFTCFTQG
jgi:hypothetical protein